MCFRFVLACTVLYELVLIFLLFQTADDARRMMKMVFPDLGVPLEETDYGLVFEPQQIMTCQGSGWSAKCIFIYKLKALKMI